MERANRPTALVARDHYMFMFTAADMQGALDQELIKNNVLTCLAHGFDVIFEGNFKPEDHELLLHSLLAAHPEENYIFYLNASLTETLRRHNTRDQILSAVEMEALYSRARPLGRPAEVVIDERSSLEETVKVIKTASGT